MKLIILILIFALITMNAHASSSRTEGNYSIQFDIYTSGVGGAYSEGGYSLYLVPGDAIISYLCGITANDQPCGGPISPVPEVPTIILLSIGLLGILLIRLKSLR